MQTGDSVIYIRRRVNGKNEKHCLGSYPDLSVEQARDKAARFTGAVAFGENSAEQRRLLQGALTLGEFFNEYLERHLKKSRKSWTEYERGFNRYFGDWKSRKLSSITHLNVERRHAVLCRERGGYAGNRSVQLIRAMYNGSSSLEILA